MTADERYVAAPGFACVVMVLWLWVTLWDRDKKIPFFDVGIFCALATLFYTVYPLVNYWVDGLQFGLLSDGRLQSYNISPAELGFFHLRHVLYLFSFVVIYSMFRGRGDIETGNVITPRRSNRQVIVLFFLLLTGYFIFLQLTTGVNYSTSYESEAFEKNVAAFASIPLLLLQISSKLWGILFLFKLAVLFIVVSRCRQKKWRNILLVWVAAEIIQVLTLQGARTGLVLFLMATALLYHRMIKPLSMKDQSKTKQVLIQELASLKQRIAELEQAESERKQAEEAPHSSEDDYRTIFKDISDAIYSVDAEGKITFISPAIEQIMGYQPGELYGKNFYQFIHKDDLSMIRRRIDDLSKNVLKSEEYRIITSTGAARWVMSFSRPLFRDGIFQGIRGVITDIHPRKLIEEALRESEEHYRCLMEDAPVGFCIVDTSGTIQYINKIIEEESGYSRQELVGQNGLKSGLLSSESARILAERFILRLAGGTPTPRSIELPVICKDGRKKWTVIYTTINTKDNVPVGAQLVMIDITERKAAEKALSESEERMRLALTGTDQGLWEFDLLSKVVNYTENWTSILGYGPEESTFDYDWWINQTHPESRPVFYKALLDYLTGHTKYLKWDYRIRNKSGQWQWVDALGVFTETDENGFPIKMIGTHRDITERKKAETELCRIYEQLRAADEQLRAQYDSLVESEQALRESEEKYRRLTETAHDVIVSVDLSFKITYVNQATVDLAGGMNPVGMSLLSFTPSHLHELQEAMMQKRREGFSEMMSFEWEINLPTGKIATFDIHATLLIKDEKPSGVLFVARNISERKRIEKALQKSEERFRLLAESARDTIWTMDMNLQYTYMSPYIKHALDYTPEEYVAIPLNKTLTPDSLELCMKVLSEELEIEKKEDKDLLRSRTIEVEHIHRNGSIVWAEVKMTFMRNAAGQATGILGYTRDITERVRTEKALQESENRLREITTQVPGVVYQFYVRPNGAMGFYYISNSSEPVLGLKPDLEGYFERFSAIVIPEHRDGFIKSIEKSVEEASEWQYEGMLQKPSGEIIWFSGNSTPSLRENEMVFNGIVQDVTDRKRMEAELLKSEQKYRHLFEKAEEGILIVRGETIEFANPALARILGWPLDRIIAHPFVSFIHPEDREMVFGRHRKRMRGETVETGYDFRIVTADGDVRWLRITSRVIDWDDTQASLSFLIDITDRRQAAEALRESEGRFFLAFNSSPGPMAISEIETGRFLDVNEQTLRLLEFTREEMMGHTSYELGIWNNPEDRTWMITHLNSKGSFREYPVRFITKSRNTLDVLWSAEIITLDSKKVLLSLFSDITDRKQAEEALQKIEEKYRLIAENTADVISILDMNLRFTYISPSIIRLRGLTVEEAMKETPDQIFTPESLKIVLVAFEEEMKMEAGGTADPDRTRILELEEYRKNGSIIWVEANLSYLRDKDGKPVGMLAVVRDITDRKQAEEEKRSLEERLNVRRRWRHSDNWPAESPMI